MEALLTSTAGGCPEPRGKECRIGKPLSRCVRTGWSGVALRATVLRRGLTLRRVSTPGAMLRLEPGAMLRLERIFVLYRTCWDSHCNNQIPASGLPSQEAHTLHPANAVEVANSMQL